MNTAIHYQFLTDASIRVDNITLRPWPDFTVLGDPEKADPIVCDLLESDDPFAMLWRGKIPDGTLRVIKCFPQCLWRGLLEVSQLHTDYFLQWSGHCPALIGLMAIHESRRQTDRDIDRIAALYRGREERMRVLGLPPTREAFRILSKVPVEDCYPAQLEQLRVTVNDPARRRLMRHLKTITTETLDTLQLPAECLDINLLQISAEAQLPQQCDSVSEVCREIMQFRQVTKKYPLWPYKGKNVTLNDLVQARNLLEIRLALGKDNSLARFPAPPLEAIGSSKLVIEPLTSVRALFKEGKEMSNCIMTYARSILEGKHYAYRMLHPERATILLRKNFDNWYPAEIRCHENGYASADTIDLVHRWAGAETAGKEVADDFPF
ncbi:PcfJ domain-containing protein [Coraliomargarita sp. SDUM461004]|uniref:PcfJ domain-containing protein n=1 Tax=Thalassobacterium sedimentorum TaxID=3041258 RepID=A0ABU1AJY3_9BACT|nr:PcfJ domain-containing protein [Coraliomargarita sp. SDUM461004]MDQ8195106.1 PcfJ domain-containing protein [Coraliomargarita sp. SDUM461004]